LGQETHDLGANSHDLGHKRRKRTDFTSFNELLSNSLLMHTIFFYQNGSFFLLAFRAKKIMFMCLLFEILSSNQNGKQIIAFFKKISSFSKPLPASKGIGTHNF